MNNFERLRAGDEIRIVAPSNSSELKKAHQYKVAKDRLESLGYKVSFGEHVAKVEMLGTAKAEDRAADLNAAYGDANVKAIIAFHGGYASNEILPLLDWDLIRHQPKPFIGYSDNTVLINAIFAMTGTVGFLGPNFGTHGYDRLWEYSLESFHDMVSKNEPHILDKSRECMSNGDVEVAVTPDWKAVRPGSGKGRLLGGNGASLYLLQGTQYQPKFDEGYILLLEEDNSSGEFTAQEFSRHLESILQLPGARDHVQGLVVGRFEAGGLVDVETLHGIISAKKLQVPVICNVDFGHTLPMLSLPIGGSAELEADGDDIRFKVSYH